MDHERELASRLARIREALISPDFDACAAAVGCSIPDSLRDFYADHDRLVSAPGCFEPDFYVQCFAPLVPHSPIVNDSAGNTYVPIATGYDGESILARLPAIDGHTALFVQWAWPSADDPDNIDMTLESLVARPWRCA